MVRLGANGLRSKSGEPVFGLGSGAGFAAAALETTAFLGHLSGGRDGVKMEGQEK
jgi:hypothetical protein